MELDFFWSDPHILSLSSSTGSVVGCAGKRCASADDGKRADSSTGADVRPRCFVPRQGVARGGMLRWGRGVLSCTSWRVCNGPCVLTPWRVWQCDVAFNCVVVWVPLGADKGSAAAFPVKLTPRQRILFTGARGNLGLASLGRQDPVRVSQLRH